MTRLATQILLGFILLFGTATLIPRGVLMVRLGRKPRGVFYIAMGLVCTFFAVLAFHYAYSVYQETFV